MNGNADILPVHYWHLCQQTSRITELIQLVIFTNKEAVEYILNVTAVQQKIQYDKNDKCKSVLENV